MDTESRGSDRTPLLAAEQKTLDQLIDAVRVAGAKKYPWWHPIKRNAAKKELRAAIDALKACWMCEQNPFEQQGRDVALLRSTLDVMEQHFLPKDILDVLKYEKVGEHGYTMPLMVFIRAYDPANPDFEKNRPNIRKAIQKNERELFQNSDHEFDIRTYTTAGSVITDIKVLFDHGLTAKSKDKNGSTILHKVLEQLNSEMPDAEIIKIFNYLRTAGADFNAKDGKGNTPLHIAVISWEKSRVKNAIRLLLTFNVSPSLANNALRLPRYLLPMSENALRDEIIRKESMGHGAIECRNLESFETVLNDYRNGFQPSFIEKDGVFNNTPIQHLQNLITKYNSEPWYKHSPRQWSRQQILIQMLEIYFRYLEAEVHGDSPDPKRREAVGKQIRLLSEENRERFLGRYSDVQRQNYVTRYSLDAPAIPVEMTYESAIALLEQNPDVVACDAAADFLMSEKMTAENKRHFEHWAKLDSEKSDSVLKRAITLGAHKLVEAFVTVGKIKTFSDPINQLREIASVLFGGGHPQYSSQEICTLIYLARKDINGEQKITKLDKLCLIAAFELDAQARDIFIQGSKEWGYFILREEARRPKRVKIVQELLTSGVDPNYIPPDIDPTQTPLACALEAGNYQAVDLLIGKYAKVDENVWIAVRKKFDNARKEERNAWWGIIELLNRFALGSKPPEESTDVVNQPSQPSGRGDIEPVHIVHSVPAIVNSNYSEHDALKDEFEQAVSEKDLTKAMNVIQKGIILKSLPVSTREAFIGLAKDSEDAFVKSCVEKLKTQASAEAAPRVNSPVNQTQSTKAPDQQHTAESSSKNPKP